MALKTPTTRCMARLPAASPPVPLLRLSVIITDLPDELLLEICDVIKDSAGVGYGNLQRTFRNLVLVNRKFNRIATPFLYAHHHQMLGDIHQETRINYGPVIGWRESFKFIKTIAEKPKLAQLVTKVSCGHALAPGQPYRYNSIRLEELQGVLAIFNNRRFPVTEYDEEFIRGDGHLRLAVAIAQMPNLKELNLYLGPEGRRVPLDLWHMLFNIGQNNELEDPLHFQQLTLVSVNFWGDVTGPLWPFFRLPSLLKLELTAQRIPLPSSWEYPAAKSPIKHLRIRETFAGDEHSVLPIISSCRALSSFEYDPFYVCGVDWSFAVLRSALEGHAASLEELRLLSYASSRVRCFKALEICVGSLQPFQNLKTLCISMHILARLPDQLRICDVLPPCLQKLNVTQTKLRTELIEQPLQELRDACAASSISFNKA